MKDKYQGTSWVSAKRAPDRASVARGRGPHQARCWLDGVGRHSSLVLAADPL